jgi:hypothetical protein
MTQPVIAPRLTPPAPSSGSGKSVRLPADVVEEQVKRVSLFTAVSAFMWGFGMLMDGLVLPAALGSSAPAIELVVEGNAVVTTLTILLVLRYAPIAPGKKVDCGLWQARLPDLAGPLSPQ